MTYQITSIPCVWVQRPRHRHRVFGSRVYTLADGASNPSAPEGTNQSITLDAAGIAPIVSDTTFGIGGGITTLGSSPTNEFIFDFSGSGVCPNCIAELQITMLAAGFAALCVFRRRHIAS
jgi:hypothetical protein